MVSRHFSLTIDCKAGRESWEIGSLSLFLVLSLSHSSPLLSSSPPPFFKLDLGMLNTDWILTMSQLDLKIFFKTELKYRLLFSFQVRSHHYLWLSVPNIADPGMFTLTLNRITKKGRKMVCLSKRDLFIHLLFHVLQMFQFLYSPSPPGVGQSTATFRTALCRLREKDFQICSQQAIKCKVNP